MLFLLFYLQHFVYLLNFNYLNSIPLIFCMLQYIQLTQICVEMIFAKATGYEKSRSLNNISGMAGSSLRLAPITSPPFENYETPGQLRRCRSPIPSIL